MEHRVIALTVILTVALSSPALAGSVTLFESDGSSLAPFACEVGLSGGGGFVDLVEGNPAPSLGYTDNRTARVAPYVLSELSVGQILRGSWDLKTNTGSGILCLAHFGKPIEIATCTQNSPFDGYWPVNAIAVRVSDGFLDSYVMGPSGIEYRVFAPLEFASGLWHRIEYELEAAADGNFDWRLHVDGVLVEGGRSHQNPGIDAELGVNIGRCGTQEAADVRYDNIRVELTCADEDGDGHCPPEDCDDQNASIYPGRTEIPGDLIDDNCDGNLGQCDPCADWRNHGQFVSCVSHAANELRDAGLLTEDAEYDLVAAAAMSDVGKRGYTPPGCE